MKTNRYSHRLLRSWRWRASSILAVISVLSSAPILMGESRAQDGDKGPSILTPFSNGMAFPAGNAAQGRRLFVTKACVVCHSVNGVGGSSAPRLDAETAFPYSGPFDFAARMWRGAKAMIALQERDIGYAINLSGPELADLSAFGHSLSEQGKLTEKEIPPSVLELMKERNL